ETQKELKKKELIEAVVERSGVRKKYAKPAVEAMIDILGESGAAVLFSTHILADVERVADRVGVLHDGALIVDATLDDLKRRVTMRVWTPSAGSALDARELPCVLRARPRHAGQALLLLDADDAALAPLRASGARLSEPETPSLEDLFIELTSEDGATSILPLAAEVAS
ncbi:MAG: hypothetical protein KDA28_13325, partial [Phycisphaerales bacterium]|nr:hypothetical protein [Phycisphaerales bacterium]